MRPSSFRFERLLITRNGWYKKRVFVFILYICLCSLYHYRTFKTELWYVHSRCCKIIPSFQDTGYKVTYMWLRNCAFCVVVSFDVISFNSPIQLFSQSNTATNTVQKPYRLELFCLQPRVLIRSIFLKFYCILSNWTAIGLLLDWYWTELQGSMVDIWTIVTQWYRNAFAINLGWLHKLPRRQEIYASIGYVIKDKKTTTQTMSYAHYTKANLHTYVHIGRFAFPLYPEASWGISW